MRDIKDIKDIKTPNYRLRRAVVFSILGVGTASLIMFGMYITNDPTCRRVPVSELSQYCKNLLFP